MNKCSSPARMNVHLSDCKKKKGVNTKVIWLRSLKIMHSKYAWVKWKRCVSATKTRALSSIITHHLVRGNTCCLIYDGLMLKRTFIILLFQFKVRHQLIVEKQLEIPSVNIHLLSDLKYTFMISNDTRACMPLSLSLSLSLAGSGSISSWSWSVDCFFSLRLKGIYFAVVQQYTNCLIH
jgi:hypothetical protein